MGIKKVLNYIIYNTIEEGSYGKVYRAQNLLTGEQCAVKMYYDRGDIEYLRKEYDILSQLDHENIIQCKAYFEQNDTKNQRQGYLVMEKGRIDLFEHLSKRLNVPEYINYIYDIIKGLEYLHSKKIVHCDIKLENIILIKNRAKIADFGLSEQLIGTVKMVDLVGTRGLIAPEIMIKGFCCRASDIWSLGKLMQYIEAEFIKDGFVSYPRLSYIFMQCFEQDYRLRPSATKLRQMFEERYKDILYDIED